MKFEFWMSVSLTVFMKMRLGTFVISHFDEMRDALEKRLNDN